MHRRIKMTKKESEACILCNVGSLHWIAKIVFATRVCEYFEIEQNGGEVTLYIPQDYVNGVEIVEKELQKPENRLMGIIFKVRDLWND